MKNKSIWLDSVEETNYRALNKDIETDILIVGGGISGFSCAYHLKDTNFKVALIERNKIGHGVTSRTTGKLTFLQDLCYSNIASYVSLTSAKKYLDSQLEAIEIVKEIIKTNNIECNLLESPSILFTNKDEDINKIKKEKALLETFGVKVEEIKELDDGTPIKYGIKANSYVFHPLKYLHAIKDICLKKNLTLYENTCLYSFEKTDDYYICKVNNNTIKTKYLILATHYPYFLIPYLFPMKVHLEKSYISATKTEDINNFNAITIKKPTISMRYHKDNDNNYFIYLTNSHNLAYKENDKKHFYNHLQPLNKIDYLWSNKDVITNDYLPLIGKIKERDNTFLITTGYNTWGMTNGSLGGKIISDIILDKENKYTELTSPKRSLNLAKFLNVPGNILSNIKSFVGSKIKKNKSWYSNNVVFKRENGKNIAIYVDKNKKEHIVYSKCPHLGCNLLFNETELTWDCPCHGSRFNLDGKCIEGPSNYDISYVKDN